MTHCGCTLSAGESLSRDPSLSELTLSDAGGGSFERTLTGAKLDDYYIRVSVPNDVAVLSVSPTTEDPGAVVERYSNSRNRDIPDADPDLDGHQVPLKVGEKLIHVRVRAEDGTPIRIYRLVVTRQKPGLSGQAAALTAEFTNAPATHIGAGATFTLQLAFSEPVANTADDLKDHAIEVTGGTVQNVAAASGRTDLWNLTIAPDGDADVTVDIETGGTCNEPGVVCTSDGTALSAIESVTIEGPGVPAVRGPGVPALTVAFENGPASHDGSARFRVEIVFSEAPHERGNRDILAALEVSGGTKIKMRRIKKDKAHRRVTVKPDGDGPVTLSFPATADCAAANALCSAAGGKLETPVSVTVKGPVAISVADARVEEAAGAELAFAVTLDRARHDTVTVDYATEDGSADVDDDYTETEGTLTFAAGETSKEVKVPVLDDAHDEGEETVLLRLSNPVGARIADDLAVGTIENTDHMPKAWLGRFGRTVADQVLDAVDARMRAPRAPGAAVSLAGQSLGLGPVFGADTAPGDAAAKGARETEAEAAEAGRRLAAWLEGAADEEDRSGLETRTVSGRELLLGSSFSLSAGAADGAGGSASLWGRAAVSQFDGRAGELTLDGEVASGLLGADWARGRWTAGLIVSHSRGEGGYRGEGGAGTVSSTLTGLYPWGRHALSERVSVWGVAGYGEGTLTLTPENEDGTAQAAIRTDMDLAMGAVGVRGVAVAAPAHGGVELSVTGDALGVRTTSAKVRGLAASEADVTRLRLGLEGSWRGLVLGTGTLEPRLELGARHDGGDAETGFGVDVGGGVLWSDPARGVSAELGGRGLLTHESAGFGERGFAASLVWDPAPASERGPSLTVARTVGESATGGMEALLRPESAAGAGGCGGGRSLPPAPGGAARLRVRGVRRRLDGGARGRSRLVGVGARDGARLAARRGAARGAGVRARRRGRAARERGGRGGAGAPSRPRARVAARGRASRGLRGALRGRAARAGR